MNLLALVVDQVGSMSECWREERVTFVGGGIVVLKKADRLCQQTPVFQSFCLEAPLKSAATRCSSGHFGPAKSITKGGHD
jgi:hypothetical protein